VSVSLTLHVNLDVVLGGINFNDTFNVRGVDLEVGLSVASKLGVDLKKLLVVLLSVRLELKALLVLVFGHHFMGESAQLTLDVDESGLNVGEWVGLHQSDVVGAVQFHVGQIATTEAGVDLIEGLVPSVSSGDNLEIVGFEGDQRVVGDLRYLPPPRPACAARA
jgi:hypothetical protein